MSDARTKSSKLRRRQLSAKPAKKPLHSRRLFLESLEDRRVMAFTPGDVFAASFVSSPFGLYNVTAGGDMSAATPLANLASSSAGQMVWSRDLSTAYVSLYGNGTVVALTSTGTVSTFATGLNGPTGLILTDDDRLLVAETGSGEITDITSGGNFAAASPFATGLSGLRNMIQLADGRILALEGNGEVTELGAGGNLSAATPFASGTGSPSDIVQSSSGAIFVCDFIGQRVLNITAGGNFAAATPFATGRGFIGLTFDGAGRLLAADINGSRDSIYDISAGGNFSAAAPFAFGAPDYSVDSTLDTVPEPTVGTLVPVINGSGNLVITDSDVVGKVNNLTIGNDGAGNIVITDANEAFSGTGGIAGAALTNGNKTLTVPIGSITGPQIIIEGGGAADTVTANLVNALGKILTFNGGTPTTNPGDKLIVSGGTHATATLNHTNASDGNVVLGTNTINYTGLEPVDITGTTITSLVINLPDTDDATDDDTKLSISAGNLIVDSLNGEHEDDSISLTGITSITVNGRKGDDKVTLDKTLKTFTGTITVNGDEGDDVTTVDLSGGSFAGALSINGGVQATVAGDKMVVAGGTLTSATLGYAGVGSGNLLFDTTAVTFTGIEQADYATTTSGKLIIDLPNGPMGENDDTKISISGGNLVVESLNGKHQKDTFSLTGVTDITVKGRDGDDKITLDTTFKTFAGNVVVNGGNGNDTLVADLSGGAFDSNLTFKGDAPVVAPGDRLQISGGTFAAVTLNHTNASDGSVVLDGKTINYEGLEPVDLTGTTITALVINLPDTKDGTDDDTRLSIVAGNLIVDSVNGEHEDDSISLTGITSITVNGRKGDDKITLDASVLDMGDKITINGGDDDDTLILDDSAETTAHTYELGGNKIGRTGKLVTFSDIKTLTLSAGTKDDALNVTSPSAATGVTTFDGGGDADSLTIDDAAGATARNYELDGNQVGRAGALVAFANVTNVVVNAGSKDDSLVLKAAASAGTNVTFNGDASVTKTGSNTLDLTGFNPADVSLETVTAGGFGGTVSKAGAVVLNFTEVDAINAATAVDDTLSNNIPAAAKFTLNEDANQSKVDISGTVLTFSKFDTVRGGTQADQFAVQKTTTIALQLEGRDGADTFTFTQAGSIDNLTKNVVVIGGAGDDTITVDDSLDAQANNYLLGSATGDSTISRDPATGVISYQDVKLVTVKSNNLDSKFSFTGKPTATTTDIQAGTGNDTLDFSTLKIGAVDKGVDVRLTSAATATFDGNARITGDVAPFLSFKGIENAKGNSVATDDTLTGLNTISEWTLDTTAAMNAVGQLNTYTDTASTKVLRFAEFEVLNGGTAKDTFKVRVNAAEDFVLNGNAGADIFTVGETSSSLANINSLKLDGGADADLLTLLDTAQAGPETYTITPSKISFEAEAIELAPLQTSFNVETINLKASKGANIINVEDGTYGTAPTVITLDHPLVPNVKSVLNITDPNDLVANTWTVNAKSVVREVPAKLTVDFTNTPLSNLSLTTGKGGDTINVKTIAQPTSVNGNLGNDVITAGEGNLDALAAGLTVSGGGEDATPTRTVFSGGTTVDTVSGTTITTSFIPGKTTGVVSGDTLNISDLSKTGLTNYDITATTVTRKTAAVVTVNHGDFELLNFIAGKDDSDVQILMGGTLPAVITVDGGTNALAKDNRLHVVGTTGDDKITIGNLTAVETDRSKFEVKNVARIWVEAAAGADSIHNRSAVPGLLDGDKSKTTDAVQAGNQNDIISSDAPSNATYSPVLLGNDGADFMTTSNNSATGMTYLVGDYFVNPNVAFTFGSATKTSRIQIVKDGATFGQPGDKYSTTQMPTKRNWALGRLDTYYRGRFLLVGDITASSLTVIEWLQAQLPRALTMTANVKMLAPINKAVRDFVRAPGSAANPVASNVTYQPLGKALPATVPNGSTLMNGGEGIEEEEYYSVTMTNPFEATDVNLDGRITAFDALVIINELNKAGARPIDTSPGGEFSGDDAEPGDPLAFLDVNGDMQLTALDALLVINKLNLGQTTYEIPEYFFGYDPTADEAEAAANEQFAIDSAAVEGQANSVSDEALLALLAADLDSDETE
ncbi:dockerin type I domain-containing protein [Anatilimnocola sp. NA78]|uniref:dockerin type I domain-containing protein n=1 Tax=Anatilimnocola sp. NA78 TaxID=3415683 RepID=UPI003CE4FB56